MDFPFWSTRVKSGAVSPSARLSGDTLVVDGVEIGANAFAPVRRRARIDALENMIEELITTINWFDKDIIVR